MHTLDCLRAGKLLKLTATVLNCEMAALVLLDGERVSVANAVGLPDPKIGPGARELDFSFAGWQLLSPNHEVLIVEDSAKDVRCAPARMRELERRMSPQPGPAWSTLGLGAAQPLLVP